MSSLSTPLKSIRLQSAMIVSLEPTEFIPCGRRFITNHPGIECLNHQHPQGIFRLDRSLVGSFSNVTLEDKKKDGEVWMLRKFNGAEEELYVNGHTVVWCKGCNVISTYTVDGIVNQAIWCSFVIDGEDPHLHELHDNKEKSRKRSMEGVAVISDDSLHVFAREGDDFVTSLPFQVRRVWKCDLGLIFERNPGQKNLASSLGMNSLTDTALPSDNALTTVFCLQHPLREFAPVVKKNQGNVRYMNRSQEVIVFCEENLVMTYDSKLGLHTVWRMRNINQDDVTTLESNMNQQMQNQASSIRQMSLSSPGTSPARASFRGSPAAPLLPNIPGANAVNVQIGLSKTPHAKNPSYAHFSHTPTSNRVCSPSVPSINYAGHSFSPLRNSPHVVRSPATPISHDSLCLNDTIHEAAEPLRPEICFEHVWSETLAGTREGVRMGRATRAFLTEDVCGQKFLVYYINALHQARVAKYGLSNDKRQYIFGAVTTLSAKDVAPLKEMKMFALLDNSGNILLYTGNVKMVKMHITGIPALSSLSLSHGLRTATPGMGTPQPVSTPAHPSRPGSVLGNMEEVGMLSPVPELLMSGDTDLSLRAIDEFSFGNTGNVSTALTGIPHVVGSYIVLQVSNGSYHKMEVPQFCTTSLVKTCIRALFKVLPNDVYLQMTKKWYTMRHCPGAMASYKSEWAIFENCLRDVIGYVAVDGRHTGDSYQMDADISASPLIAAKKSKQAVEGSDLDWEYVLESEYHEKTTNLLSQLGWSTDPNDHYSCPKSKDEPEFELTNKSLRRSSLERSTDRIGSAIHPITPVFCALHLVYEEQKLNTMTWDNTVKMAKFLQQLANDMGRVKFSRSYAMDHPDLIRSACAEKKDVDPQIYRLPYCFGPEMEPNIFQHLFSIVESGKCSTPFPVIPDVTPRIEQIVSIYDCLFIKSKRSAVTVALGPFVKSSTFKKEKSVEIDDQNEKMEDTVGDLDGAQEALKYMVQAGITEEDLSTLPHGVALPVLVALHKCKELPYLTLPDKALKLIGRVDLLRQNSEDMMQWKNAPLSSATDPNRSAWQSADSSAISTLEDHEDRVLLSAVLELDSDEESGPNGKSKKSLQKSVDDNVTRLLFPKDHRMYEVWRLLQAGRPVKVDLVRQVAAGDQDFAEQAKSRLLEICNRTMALAVGRGMVYLRTETPNPTQPFQMPKMNLTGRYLPENTTVTLEGGSLEIPADMKSWPLFHNGVAAGLQITPQKNDSAWIYLNKGSNKTGSDTKTGTELTPEHAGFLLSAGLNGHLEKLHTLKIHDYLSHAHQMTTIAILLGLGASKCGSCDLTTMRLLSVHVPAFLPPTSTEFEVPRTIQIAAVTAAGFLYLGSAQRLVAEVMLREIDRSPNPENDDGRSREAYALSCGLALGTVTLGRGGIIPELADLNIANKLYHYMTGKKKTTKDSVSQSMMMEGEQINTEITAPGAIVALALMYLKTNNTAISEWLATPQTWLLLESVKPQHLMLRTMAKCLIMWDFVEPTMQYVKSLLGVLYIEDLRTQLNADSYANQETFLQCYAAVMSGAALGIGLRFAGTQSSLAYNVLLSIAKTFLKEWNESGSQAAKYMGKYTLELALTICLLASSMVVSGSGDMEILQICRYLHMKLDQEINYGVQMAIHMAIGFLFLGNCRRTLSTSNKAIAALVTSVYPCFPCSSTDNQYHLQALRHFYVLATEERLLVPIDSETNLPCYAKIDVKYNPHVFGKEYVFSMIAPCLLPESRHLKEVEVNDPRHWPLVINAEAKHCRLQEILEKGLSVQRRTGFQPYLRDPKGYQSRLALSSGFSNSVRGNSLLTDDSFCVKSFVGVILDYCKATVDEDCNKSVMESKTITHMSSLLKNFVLHERTRAIYSFYGFIQILNQLRMSRRPNPLAVWQLKLAAADQMRRFCGINDPDAFDDRRFVSLLVTSLESHFQRILKAGKADLDSLLGIDFTPRMCLRQKEVGGKRRASAYKQLDSFSGGNQSSTNISIHSLWSFSCFSIFYSLPPSFMFSENRDRLLSCVEFPDKRRVFQLIMKLGLPDKPAAQLLKALFAT